MDTVIPAQKVAVADLFRHNYRPRVTRVPAWLRRVWSWL